MLITKRSLVRGTPEALFKEAFRRFKAHGYCVRPPCDADVRDVGIALADAIDEAHDVRMGNGDDHTSGRAEKGGWLVEVRWDTHKPLADIRIYERFRC